MDSIQAFLITSGRKDLAQDYFNKLLLQYQTLRHGQFDFPKELQNLANSAMLENQVITPTDLDKIDDFILKLGGEKLSHGQKSNVLTKILIAVAFGTEKILVTSKHVEELLSTLHKKQLNKYFDIVMENAFEISSYDLNSINIFLIPTNRLQEIVKEVNDKYNKMTNLRNSLEQLQNNYIKKTYG